MTRSLASQRLIVAATELGYRQGANGSPRSQNTPMWITRQASLGTGLSLSNAVLNSMAREVYAAYLDAYDRGAERRMASA